MTNNFVRLGLEVECGVRELDFKASGWLNKTFWHGINNINLIITVIIILTANAIPVTPIILY